MDPISAATAAALAPVTVLLDRGNRGRGRRPFSRIRLVGIFAIVLLACAVLIVIGAEWPRLSARFAGEGRSGRARKRQKQKLTVIEGEGDEDDFAASVERDLASLPVIEERDGRSRR